MCVYNGSSNKGRMAISSFGKKMKYRTKAMRKMRLIKDIYATAPHCTLEDLERRNNVQAKTNPPDQIGRDKEANIAGNSSMKLLKVDGEKKINDQAITMKSAGIKSSSSKLRKRKSISSYDNNSKQPRIILMNNNKKQKHTTKDENKIELSNNHHTLSDSPVKDQARTAIESFSGTDPNLLQLSDSLGCIEDFDICSRTEVSMDSKGRKGNTFLEAIPTIPGPPGSFLPSPPHMDVYSDQDLTDRDSSDPLMSAAFPVLRLMGKDLIIVNIPTE